MEVYDVAGGICESTDYLAKDVSLPKVKKGDYLKFLNVGAYGSSMSSNYNSRPRVAEVMVDGDQMHLVRARETIEDLVRGEQLLK